MFPSQSRIISFALAGAFQSPSSPLPCPFAMPVYLLAEGGATITSELGFDLVGPLPMGATLG